MDSPGIKMNSQGKSRGSHSESELGRRDVVLRNPTRGAKAARPKIRRLSWPDAHAQSNKEDFLLPWVWVDYGSFPMRNKGEDPTVCGGGGAVAPSTLVVEHKRRH